MTGIFELCSMSGFSKSGMAESWSEEVTALPTMAGNGGWRTYCANCDGAAAASVAAAAGCANSAVDDCGDDPDSAVNAVVLWAAENMTVICWRHHLCCRCHFWQPFIYCCPSLTLNQTVPHASFKLCTPLLKPLNKYCQKTSLKVNRLYMPLNIILKPKRFLDIKSARNDSVEEEVICRIRLKMTD